MLFRSPRLLQVVQEDGQKFFEKVCYTHRGTIEYEDLPILAHISVNDFVDAWLASPRTGWYWICNALKERNKASHHYPSLKPEAVWYQKVVLEMEKRAKQETGLAKLRIIRTAELVGLPRAAPRKTKVKPAAAKASKRTK